MRILFATDGTAGSRRALDLLADLPLTASDHVTVVSVAPPRELSGISRDLVADPRALRLASASAREAVAAAGWRLGLLGVPTSEVIETGATVEAIVARSLHEAPQLIVIGSRGRGLWHGTLLGSTARRLARCSPVPVLVVRGRRAAPEHVLAVVDDSAGSLPSIQLLARLPLPTRSEIVVLHLGRGPAAERLERPIEQARMFLARPHPGICSPTPPTSRSRSVARRAHSARTSSSSACKVSLRASRPPRASRNGSSPTRAGPSSWRRRASPPRATPRGG